MSYYNQGPPPPGQGYPPPQHQQYPQQGGPPQQQPYGQPPQQMNQGYYQQGPPPQQQWGQPPPQQGGYGPPQGSPYPQGQAPYGAPPGPPPGQYNQGPPPPQMGGYGSPAPQQQWGGAPPPGPPPQQQQGQQYYGGGGHPQQGGQAPPDPPSMGYVPGQQAQMDMGRAADDLRSAMKGFGTDEDKMINVLRSLDALQINSVKTAFQQRHRRDLMKDVHSETSGYFRHGLESIIRGPLDNDCNEVHESIKGAGTKESGLNDVLLLRSNADMEAIKQRYQQMFKRSLASDVKGDLSMKTERLFSMALEARRPSENSQPIPQQVDTDVQEIYRCTEGKTGTDQIPVCEIFTHRSKGQLRAVSQAYKSKYHRSLDSVIDKEFSGHMQQALLYILRGSEDPAKHDADLVEEACKGMGTKDLMLVRRIVMFHWNRERLQQVKGAYKHFYKREMVARVKGELSGDYSRLITACIN